MYSGCVKINYKKIISITLVLLFLTVGAVSAASESNDDGLVYDLTGAIMPNSTDTVEFDDNAVIDEDNLEDTLKMGAIASDDELKDIGITTVNNWTELKSAINDGAVIELAGDDVYYAEGSAITIGSGTITIDGKGHTIDAQRLDSRIFEINNGAALILKNLILSNAYSYQDGGAIYNNEGTLTVVGCKFTNNTAESEKGGAIYNNEGTLKIINSIFDKNAKYDRAIYNYGTEDNPFRLTVINTTMIEDKVAVNYCGNERRLDDKRDIDLLTSEVNAYILAVNYVGTPVLISVSEIDNDFTGRITVNITNTIYNTEVWVAGGTGNTTMELDINRYTARFKNFISVTEEAFERDDTKPYLEINFKVVTNDSFTALDDMINSSTTNVTLNQDYIYDSRTDDAYFKIDDKTLTIHGNGHSISGGTNNGDTLFLIEHDSNVTMENIILENGHAQSRSHLGSQIRMGGAIYVSRSNLTIINSTLKNNKAEGGSGGAIYSDFSTLNIISTNFTNNNAANGKNIYIQGGDGAYILNSIIDEKDVYNEPDWDNNDQLAQITILNDLNPAIYIPDYDIGKNASLIIEPDNFIGAANMTVNNQTYSIEITNGHASADLNLDLGSYTATITTPDIIYYSDSERNLTCTYLSATTKSNEFTVYYAPKTYIVNNSNVDEIFNGTDNTLSDFINPKDILDINGTIDKNRNLVINKPVNIISSEKNAVINLHTVIGDTENNIPKFSFIINEGASGSNISDLYINNTQTWIYNVDGLYLKNINISVRSAFNLGAETGHTSIRYCNDITLDSCSIFTENTQASCLVVYVTSNFTFINSKIEGQGKIGPLITLECPNEVYDMPYDEYVVTCTNNTIKNSIIKTGYPDACPIENINADHTTIDGVNVYASMNIKAGQYATVMNSNFYNASGIILDSYSVAYNNTVDGSTSMIQNGADAHNNTFSSVTIRNGVFENNVVKNKLTVSSPANVDNNTIGSIELSSGSKYSNITNNIISGTITVNDVNVTIKFNTINTTNDYAVKVNKEGAVITNNKMYAETKFGDDAVDRFQDTTVVEDNNPQPSYKLLQWIIDGATGSITLGQDYYFNEAYDDEAFDGVIINKDLKIIGNGYTIDGKCNARIFQIVDGANVVIENVTFINGKAQSNDCNGENHDVGGAITVKSHSNLTIINCSFTNNHADQNGLGGAIFITGNSTLSIMTSNFTDSDAQDAGKVLYVLDGNYVHILDSNVDGINIVDIDINDIGDYIRNDKGEMGLLAPIKIFMATDLMAEISNYTEGENAQINITEPSNFSGRATLNVDNKTIVDIQFNDEGTASVQLDVTAGKSYKATLTNDYTEYAKDISLNIAFIYVPATTTTNSFKVMKKPNIQFDVKNITYNQTQTIKATMNGTGYVTIKLNMETIVDSIFVNETVSCTVENLNAGDYSIELNYSGDEFTVPGIAVYNFTVFKANSSLEINDIIFDYKGTGSTTFSYDNATDVRAEVVDHPNASVKVNGSVIYVSNLNVGSYTLSVTTITDNNHNSITKTADITVNKAPTEITISNETFDLKVNDAVSDFASLTPGDVGNLTYTVSNSSVVKVENGKIVALAEGSAIVTVSFAGDDNYATADNKTIDVTVSLNDASVSVNNSTLNLLVGDMFAVVAITVPSGLDVTYIPDESGVVSVDFNGVVTALKEGTGSILVKVGGDGIYAENSTIVTVTVNEKPILPKENLTIRATAKPITSGENATVVVTGLENATGNISVRAGDGVYSVPIEKGTANIIIPGLKETTAAYVNYAGDETYNPTSTSVDIIVNPSPEPTKKNLTIHASAEPIVVGEDATVVVAGLENATGNVSIIVNGKTYISPIKNGETTVSIPGLTENVTAYVNYPGDKTYNSASTAVNITVNPKAKENATIIVYAPEITEGENATVTVTLPSDATGSVTVGDEVVLVQNGTVSAVLTNLPVGNTTVPITYSGDDKYNSIETSIIVTVNEKPVPPKENLTISAAANPITVGEDASVVVSGLKDATGNVTVAVSGKTYSAPIKKGIATVTVPGLTKNVTASVTYAGDENYNGASASVDIVVNPKPKENATISIDAPAVTEGENATVTVTLPSDATGTVSVGNETVPVKNGTATVKISDLPVGNITVPVTYSGDDKYNSMETEVSVTVNEDTSDIILAPDVTKYYKGSERFVVTVTDYEGNPLANKTVKININKVDYTRTTDANGTASMALGLPSNTYNVIVTVDNQTANSVVIILPTVNGTDVVKMCRNSTQYYATFKDSEGNYLADGTTVRFNINGVMYDRKVSGEKGQARLNLNLPAGEYVITAINPANGEMAANNITILSTITENKDITKYYRNGTQYTVKILGADGKAVGKGVDVKFNINGVFYTRQTDESGIAKLSINLPAGDYVITAEYNGCKVANNIKVLPVLTAKDITMKYRDGTKFAATLVDGQGKPYAGQSVQFNINGVLYNRVTGSDGVAKLNINLMAGQYIITSSYNGSNIANKITISG